MRLHMLTRSSIFFVATGVFFSNVALASPVELSLERSIQMALQNNPAIHIAAADQQKAVWSVAEAKTGKRVSGNYAHTASHLKTSPTAIIPSDIQDNFDNNITLSLPLYTGGKVEGTVKQAEAGLKIANLSVEKTRQQIKLDATTSYYSVLQARNLVKVSEESVASLTQHLENTKAHYAAGTVAKSDMLRSQVELANAQQDLIKAENAYKIAISALNNVIGLPLTTEVQISEELGYDKYNRSLDECFVYAMGYRPEIAQAAATIDSAGAGVTVARSGKMPTVVLSGVTNWNDSSFPGADNNNWSVNLTASVDFLDSGLTKSKVKEAYADLEKIKQQAKQTQDSVRLEVHQAYLNMQEADKRIATSSVTVAQAEEDFRIARTRYNAGVGTNLDVLDAQVAFTQAKTNFYQALYDYNVAKANLDRAIGAE